MHKKICYVTTIPGTMRAFFVTQLQHLDACGYEVCAICSPDDIITPELKKKVRVISVPISRGIAIKGLKKTIDTLTDVFKREKFDLVQYSTPNAAFCSAIAAKRAGIKIRNYHLMGFRYLGFTGVKKLIFKALEKVTCHFSTHIECITPSNMEMGIRERVFPKEKVCIVGNGSTGGIDTKRFDYERRNEWRKAVREELGYSEADFVFGFVGRITRDKGINELLEAFAGIKENCKLLFIGTAEGLDTLDKKLYAEAQEDTRIQFHSRVKDVEKYYAALDVLLLPSWREGFGMVIAEAAAMGTPAIVSRIPGPIDVISDGETALTVNVKDAADLKEKMEMLLQDSALREKLGKNGVSFIREKFDSQYLLQKIAERKEELLSVN